MDAVALKQNLAGDIAVDLGEVLVFEELDSTNEASIRLLLDRGYSHRLVCAQRQTAGRGRRGRIWHSPDRSGIYMSVTRILPPLPGLNALSLVTALSVAAALEQVGLDTVRVKWPNDVLIGGAKLAGVLLERKQQDDKVALVIGIGVNFRFSESDRALIGRPVTDLASQMKSLPGQHEIVASICRQLLSGIDTFLKQGFAAFIERWNQQDLFIDRRVRVREGDRERWGIHRGVDAQGALLVEGARGQEAIHGGEIFPSVSLADPVAGNFQ